LKLKGYRTAGKIFIHVGWLSLIFWIFFFTLITFLSDKPITEGMTRGEIANLCLIPLSTVGPSIFYLIVGKAIKEHKEWARIVGIILSILELLAFPIGTLIGGYTLWCLKTRWNVE